MSIWRILYLIALILAILSFFVTRFPLLQIAVIIIAATCLRLAPA